MLHRAYNARDRAYMMIGYLPIYTRARRYRGGGFFNFTRKFMAPIGRSMFSGVKSLARNKTFQKIGKKALQKGVEVTANVAVDALQGRNVGESIRDHSRQAALNALVGPDKPRKLKQRKRRASAAVLHKSQTKRKRRKTTLRAALNRKHLF